MNPTFFSPPKPNIKLMIGENANTYFQYYCKKPPNAIQRYLLKKLLGIQIEKL